MKITSKYILRNLAAPLFFGTFTIVFLFVMQFLMNNLYKFVGKGLDDWLFVQLVIYNLPWMTVISMPMGVVFACVMGFGTMSANNEITVLKAGGESLYKMMRPVIIFGILLTYFMFWFNDEVLPESNHKAKVLFGDMQRAKPTMILEPGQFSNDIEGYSILARTIDTSSNKLYGLTVYEQKNPNNQNIITADSGTMSFSRDYSHFIIEMQSGEIHSFRQNRLGQYKRIDFEDYKLTAWAYGFGFSRTDEEDIRRDDREMNIKAMRKIVWDAQKVVDSTNKKIKRTLAEHLDYIFLGKPQKSFEQMFGNAIFTDKIFNGNITRKAAVQRVAQQTSLFSSILTTDVNRINSQEKTIQQYTVEIQKKYAIPIACILFVFVGCPLGIMSKKGNFGFAAGISFAFYIFYWAFLMGGEKFADRGVLPANISMWVGNAIILIMGLLLTARVNNESFRIGLPKFLLKKK
ncbi:MAG: LptF/LptG family permease [bacterium]